MNCPLCDQEGEIVDSLFIHKDSLDAIMCPQESRHITGSMLLPALRDYQEEAVQFTLDHNHSMVVLPTGQGKTLVGIYLIDYLKLPALIVCPTIHLTEQWERMIRELGGKSTTFSSEGKAEFSDITAITYDSALGHLSEIERYKFVIFDESHHLFSPEYKKIVYHILDRNSSIRLLALTASPRTYGEEKEIQDKIFPDKYVQTIAQRQHTDQAVALTFVEHPILLSFEEQSIYNESWDNYTEEIRFFRGFLNLVRSNNKQSSPEIRERSYKAIRSYQKVKKMLSEHPDKIEETIKIILSSSGKFIIFGDTIKMVDILYKSLKERNIACLRIHSKLKQDRKEREKILQSLRSGESRILIGSYAIEEGLDLPDLDNAIFFSIITAGDRRNIQRSGRVMRSAPGKNVHIHVIYAKHTIEETNLKKIKKTLGVK